jgi:hypothetical protein
MASEKNIKPKLTYLQEEYLEHQLSSVTTALVVVNTIYMKDFVVDHVFPWNLLTYFMESWILLNLFTQAYLELKDSNYGINQSR